MAHRVKTHANIPIFIPHMGCPNACVFCDQRVISGQSAFDPQTIRPQIDQALSTLQDCPYREIAFFGGSFTGIDRGLMLDLLNIAQAYVEQGRVEAIRLSTRPDYMDDEILSILSRYAVKTVELGLQSMDDRVLAATRRGHNSESARRACRMIKAHGFDLIGQMMIGLPEADGESERMTARMIAELGADGARVYPTVVFRSTELCRMAERGDYRVVPQEEMCRRTADVLEIFDREHIPVIRIGLCATETLSSQGAVLGEADVAIGERAMGEVFYRRMQACLLGTAHGDEVTFAVPPGAISRAVGQRRANTERLCREFRLRRIRVREDARLGGYEIEFVE